MCHFFFERWNWGVVYGIRPICPQIDLVTAKHDSFPLTAMRSVVSSPKQIKTWKNWEKPRLPVDEKMCGNQFIEINGNSCAMPRWIPLVNKGQLQPKGLRWASISTPSTLNSFDLTTIQSSHLPLLLASQKVSNQSCFYITIQVLFLFQEMLSFRTWIFFCSAPLSYL